ncbi:MAG: toxin TcdB middle/N-terminal domain-containing protein [Pseudomonadota bacterium]
MSIDIGFASQAPSLPGAGSGGGLGETFTPDLASGTGSFSVPFELPHGPNDVAPKLALRYDSSAGNGPFGLGWSLALPRILRSSMIGRVRYDDSDTLMLEGAGPLLRLADGRLQPEVDSGDWRIETLGDGFRVTDRAGLRFELGADAGSRIAGLGGATWAWLLRRIEDNLGNIVTFEWRAAGAQRYLASIAYGPYRVLLHYAARPDRLRWGRGGFLLHTDERCVAFELHLEGVPAGASLVRRWALDYASASPNAASLLAGVTLHGFDADGASLSAPPLRFGYTEPGAPSLERMGALDQGALPPGLDARGKVELVDWFGCGMPDLLHLGDAGTARVWPNLGGRWGRPVSVGVAPQLAAARARAALIDFDGDGIADLVRIDQPLQGMQARDAGGFKRPVAWRQAPSVALASPACRLGDFDGDGMVDLLWSAGGNLMLGQRDGAGGWQQRPTVIAARPNGPPTRLDDPHVFCADMSGDGTPDVVRVDGQGVTYWPYLGYGVFGEAVRMLDPPRLPFDLDPSRLFVADLDGDGCAEVIYVDDGLVRWWPNRAGDGFEPAREIAHLPTGAMSRLRIADLRGNGSPGLCWSSVTPSGAAQWMVLEPLGGARCGLLCSIDNSLGRQTSIGYANSAMEAQRDRLLGQPWSSRLPIVLPLVGRITVSERHGASSSTVLRYHEGRYDGALREVCGFGRVESDDLGDDAVAGLRTVRWFHTGLRDDGAEPASMAERRRLRALRGRLRRQERLADDGSCFDRLEQTWSVSDAGEAGAVCPRLTRSVRQACEGAPDPFSWIETEQLDWDEHGNVIAARERSFAAGVAEPGAQLDTSTSYAHDPAGRFRQRLAQVIQRDGAGLLLAHTRTEYDGLPFGQVGGAGLVSARRALALTDAMAEQVYGVPLPDFAALGYTRQHGVAGWWVELGRYRRSVDAAGVHGQVTGPRGGVTALDFDPTGCYPVRVRDMVGNEIVAQFDLRAYQPTSVVDPSGAASHARFDALARLVHTVAAGDSEAEPTVAYRYDSAASPLQIDVTRRTAPGAAPLVQRQFLDGSARLLQRRVLDQQGELVEVANVYGARGMLLRTYLPYRPAGAAYSAPDPLLPHTAMTYDGLGRALSTVRPDGARASLRYRPGLIEEADQEDNRVGAGAAHAGTVTRRHVDAAGHVIRVEQLLGAHVLTSRDDYDVKGRLLRHTDAANVETRFHYDLLGRPLQVLRPEARQTTLFDASGNTVWSRRGDSVVWRSYDLANRPLSVRHGGADTAPLVRYTYHDNGAPAPADAGQHTAGGRLVRVDDEAGSTVFDYDLRGRLARKTMRAEGQGALALHMAYRCDGLIDHIVYPDATLLQYRYDVAGRLRAIDGVIDAIDYDMQGNRGVTRYANGLVQQDQYDPATGWRSHSRLAGAGATLRELGYRYDLVGNVLGTTSADPALAWTYEYDDLYRLTHAGAAAGHWHYGYDAGSNIVSNSALGAYEYGGPGVPATCLRSAGAEQYGYDGRGMLVSAPWGAHHNDDEGRLRRIDLSDGGQEAFTYAHSGHLARHRQVGADGAAVHDAWSPDQLVRVDNGQLILQFSDGQRIVARRRAGQTEWLHVDHLGSLVLLTDALGAAQLTLHYGPYGQVLARGGAGAASQGYGAGAALGPGLVLLGARWYCPRIGRFLAPDAHIADAGDPLAWSLYAYCRCNPTSYIDPSGRSFWKVFGGILATVAIIAVAVVVSVFTFGIATPGAVAFSVGALSVTWGAVFAVTMVGIVAGGVIGGIAAGRAGGDAGEVMLGVLVGAAVGGWAAFGGLAAGVGVAGSMGLTAGTVSAGAVAGGVSGMINGAAMGFATGFAGGKNNGLKDIMEKVLVGAIVGTALGAGLGALSGAVPAKDTFADRLFKPDAPSLLSLAPTPPVTTFGDAMAEVGKAAGGKFAGAAAPMATTALKPFAASLLVQVIVIDTHTAGATLFWDDIQQYVRTHDIDLGPFDFVKSET